MKELIRKLKSTNFESVLRIINSAADAYRGIIPEDRWKEPYMPSEELIKEIDDGVEFYGWLENGLLVAVMGIQQVNNVTLIRHAYVLQNLQRRGIGKALLQYLLGIARSSEVLVGTWEAAYWAVRFYEKNSFRLVSANEKDRLLRKYWKIPERQIETSVVLKLKRKGNLNGAVTAVGA
jgi:GNAT superfamily N-acetyltransferase